MARLGALAELQLDHLDLRIACVGRIALLTERAIVVTAAELAKAELTDQVAAVPAVVWADRAFAGVVREVAAFGAAIQRQDGVGGKAPKLVAEMSKTLALYGWVQPVLPLPIEMRKSCEASSVGAIEWLSHS